MPGIPLGQTATCITGEDGTRTCLVKKKNTALLHTSCNATAEAGKYDPDVARLAVLVCQGVEFALSLDVDPQRVRQDLAMRGMQHYAEFIGIVVVAMHPLVMRSAHPASNRLRKQLVPRGIQRAARLSRKEGFHALTPLEADTRRFRQDVGPYLKACWLLERILRDRQQVFRERIGDIRGAILGQLPDRGPAQRMHLSRWLKDLGLVDDEEHRRLAMEAFPHSSLALRRPFEWFANAPRRQGELASEILALTNQGLQPLPKGLREVSAHRFGADADFFEYAWGTLSRLVEAALKQKDVKWDMVCELLECLAELGGETSRSELMSHARAQILERGLNADGSFGDYAKAEAAQGGKFDVKIGSKLRTTLVCLEALLSTSPGMRHLWPEIARLENETGPQVIDAYATA